MPSVVALIPARSGSKRIEGKNVRRLGEHPLMAYAIAAARESGVFDAVICSTDSERHAEIARHYGAEVPFMRPAEFATATSPDIEWVEYSLKQLRAQGRDYECFSILRPTSPFRTAQTIRRAWDAFLAEKGVDSLRAVEKVTQHPGKMWVIRGNRMLPLLPLSPDQQPWHSSQMAALPEVWVQNASLEIAWGRNVLSGLNIAGVTVMPFVTDAIEGFDINNQHDWNYAEAILAQGKQTLPGIAQAPFAEASRSEDRVG
jgi:CMP-N,N'-diacetyllegionaminic acid synthase